MSDPKPFIPSFFKSKSLDNPDEVISYILHYYTRIPSKIFNNYQDLEISLRKDIAEAGGNNEKLKELIINSLTSAIIRYYPSYAMLDIDVDFESYDPKTPNDPDVNIIINISAIINGIPISLNLEKQLVNIQPQ